MTLRIDSDKRRFDDIIKGKVRDNLKKYISQDNLIGKQGNDLVKIPVHNLDLPRFMHNDKQTGGVGMGLDGPPGTPMPGQPDPNGKPGQGKAGQGEGEHGMEVELSVDDLTTLLGESLELPNIENKGKKNITTTSRNYNNIGPVGPEGQRHFKRTYKEALKREISMGNYKPGNMVIPIRADKRYRVPDITVKQTAACAIIYIMDISGSMGDNEKRCARTLSFWMNAWIKKQYKDIETRWLVHDSICKEVDEDTFFKTTESGGTMISSAYQKCWDIMQKDYPFDQWNVYIVSLSDGDNWSDNDSDLSLKILNENISPNSNLFCYAQTESAYGSGQFFHKIKESCKAENIISARIENSEGILPAIKAFLGKGK